MGARIARILQNSSRQEDRMLDCLRLMKKVFVSQLLTLAIEGALVGYYITNIFLIFKKQFETEEFISPLCELCKVNNFQLICSKCKTILGCEDCFRTHKISECCSCKHSLKQDEPIKIYMN